MFALTRARLLTSLFLIGFIGVGVTSVPALPAQEESAADEVAVAEVAAEEAVTEEAVAEEAEVVAFDAADSAYTINTLIMFICAVLVLFMQAGFAMVEVGLNSAKNTVNILFKNVMDLSVGVILFLFIGFG